MSTVAEIIERQEHNRRVERAHRSIWRQSEWGNLSFLYVEPQRLQACPRCNSCDVTDDLDRFGVIRRRFPMLTPHQVRDVVQAGLRAEAAMLATFQGGNRG